MTSTMTENFEFEQLPSPPLSPSLQYEKLESKPSEMMEEKLEKAVALLSTPKENSIEISKEEILRYHYMELMEEGVKINEDMVPYEYAIEKLHHIGKNIINKRTENAVPLRVYEIDKDTCEEYWVHPLYLSLQSFQFYKLFEEVMNGDEEEEEDVIEIEVPSLPTFRVILYYLYSGDRSKLLEIAKLDESLCQGIIENINYLEINVPTF